MAVHATADAQDNPLARVDGKAQIDGQAIEEEVVVTGSRAITNSSESPTPVAMAPMEALQLAAPSNIADGLNQLPQFMDSNSPTKFTNNGNNSPAGNFLNLRGVGAFRSLVLMDGRRVPPTTLGSSVETWVGSVDVNSLPQMLVERVDVVTAGASAVYGSDALSGVVNFILDKDFTGFKGLAQGGVSSYGDNDSYRFGVAYGTGFAEDRGHLEFSAEHYDSGGIPDRADRPEGRPVYIAAGAGTDADPIRTVANARFSILAPGGLALTGPFAGQQFSPDGALAPFVQGEPLTSTGPYMIGGDGDYWHQQSLVQELTTGQAFARASYDVTDSLNAYVQGSYAEAQNRYNNLTNFSIPGAATTRIFSGNAFLSADAQQQLTNTGTPSFLLARFYPELGPMHISSESKTQTATAGFDAQLGSGWALDGHYTYGESTFDSTGSNFLQSQKFYAAIDAVRDASGNIVCRVTQTNPGLYPDCVAFNAMGVAAASPAAADYVTDESIFHTRTVMNDVALNIRGEPIALWAGLVSVAGGLEYRTQSLRRTSNSAPEVPLDFTGLRGVGTSSAFFIGNIGGAHGSEHTKEAFAEVDVPLLADVPLAKALNLNGAVRYADYSISGSAVTWKAGLVYRPHDDLRIRATRSRDFRAPSLYDLFANGQSNPAPLTDPHTGVSGIVTRTSGGNTNLEPEDGDTFTVGFVYQPGWLSGFSASIDYYELEITNAIGLLGVGTIVSLCEAAGGTGQYCDLITRPLPFSDRSPANFPTAIFAPSINSAFNTVKGIDFDFAYATPLGPGDLSSRLMLSYLDSFETQQFPGGPVLQSAGLMTHLADSSLSHPRWHGALNLTYSAGALTAFVQERFVGTAERGNPSVGLFFPTQDGQGGGGQVYADNSVPAVFYTDITLSYEIPMRAGRMSLFGTVNNVFDKRPPIIPRASLPQIDYPTIQYVYDVVGTYFTAGVRVEF
jgi:outer membrane receptor protein involved in Fe transport